MVTLDFPVRHKFNARASTAKRCRVLIVLSFLTLNSFQQTNGNLGIIAKSTPLPTSTPLTYDIAATVVSMLGLERARGRSGRKFKRQI
jgi:hypothetical protein